MYQMSTKCEKKLVDCGASWNQYLLALQPDLVVLGKQTVLSVEPWSRRYKLFYYLIMSWFPCVLISDDLNFRTESYQLPY